MVRLGRGIIMIPSHPGPTGVSDDGEVGSERKVVGDTDNIKLRKISEIKSVKWVRLLYTHPAHIYDELIDEISRNNKICNYIDLPIQHINDKILKTMGRSVNRLQISRLIDKLRTRIENLILRTSIIVGFPGETEKRFDELLDFVESIRFERLGVFVYSCEENTPASLYKSQIRKKLKDERYETLMSIQQGITFENNKKMIGKKVKVYSLCFFCIV